MNEERKIATKEEKMRARKNDNKTKLVAVLVAIALLVVAGVIYVFQSNGGKLANSTTSTGGFPYSVESTSNENYIKSTKANIVMLSNTLLEIINPSNGAEVKSITHFFSSPVFETNGKYILTYDQGRYKFRIDTATKTISEGEVPDNILTACISENGTYAVATKEGQSGSKITVYSKSLKELFTWKSTDSYIIDCELTSDGNKIAVATVTSDNAVLKTVVHVLDVKKRTELKSFEYFDSVVSEMKYVSKNDLFVMSNSFCAYISNNEESRDVLKKGEQTIYNCGFSDNGNVSIVFGSVVNSHKFILEVYNKNAKKHFSKEITEDVKKLVSSNSSVSVLLAEKIEKYNMKGELIGDVTIPKSADSFVQFGSNEYLLDVDKIVMKKIEAVKS